MSTSTRPATSPGTSTGSGTLTSPARDRITAAAAGLVTYLETGRVPAGLFDPDLFADLTFPHWRLQTTTAADLVAVRAERHPCPGSVRVERLDESEAGFWMQFEERWEDGDQHWYCREAIRADLRDGRIIDFALYCTGDWDEATQRHHAAVVRLPRP